MSELPRGLQPAEPPAPRQSASAIVLRPAGSGEWEVLLGLRSRRARFMPGHLACPGGALEPADRPDEPEAFRRCASRELSEETGIDVATSSWIEAGLRITPAMFPVRFHTRFFVAELPPDLQRVGPASEENESFRLARPAEVLETWHRGEVRLPPPILPIMRALASSAGQPPAAVARLVAEANAQEELAPRIEFTPDVWMLPVRAATLPPATHTNVWMPGGNRFVVIDPGATADAELARLYEVVERRRQLGHEPLAIALTHHHGDHTAGCGEVARRLGIPVWAHAKTLEQLAPSIEGLDVLAIEDGQMIDLDGMLLRVLHTPGHAEGHLAFHIEDRGLLIAGDLISGLSTILIDPEHGDMDAYLESLARVNACQCRMLLPGHGPPLPGGRLEALIDHRRERERRILAALQSGSSGLSEIALAAYADTPGLPAPLIEGQALAHLRRLERCGLAARVAAGWRAADTS